METPTDHRLRSWGFAGIVIWVIVGAGMVVRGASEVLGMLAASLSPFMVAGVLVTLVRPLTRWLKARGMAHGLAALLGTLLAVFGIAALVALFAGPVISGGVGFFTSLPETVNRISVQLQEAVSQYSRLSPSVRSQIESLLQTVGNWAAGFAANGVGILVNGVSSVFAAMLSLLMGLILTFWFLKDGPRLSRTLLGVFPRSLRDDAQLVARSFDNSFSGYLAATAINVLAIFVLNGLGFSIIKLPYGWFVAAMIGVVGIIPFVGSILAAVIAVLVGLTSGVQIGVITGVIVLVVDQFVYSFLGPIVAGRAVTLHPVAVIFALAVGASLGGLLGAILALPVAAAIRTVYIYYRDTHAAEYDEDSSAADVPASP
jgi:predicted PurR-regulated permease PerM